MTESIENLIFGRCHFDECISFDNFGNCIGREYCNVMSLFDIYLILSISILVLILVIKLKKKV
ncbi:MAG: hypothetical protein M0R17_05770 [Candidatus Omnitrophica bacterium]|jgi:hypothetical protein|nr:hypothetical protein [Candidatus Omnitrophota bacterium]